MTGKEGVAGRTLAPAAAGLVDLELFVIVHYPRLIRLAGMVTHDAEAAQDAVQAALERAWRNRGDLADPDRLHPWLDRIVVREAIRIAGRRRGWLGQLLGTTRVEWIDVEEHRAARQDVAAEVTLTTTLRAAFAALSPGHRAVVALHLHAGYSVEETAGILGVPADTVRSRLRAARRRLRDEIGEVAS